MYTYTHLCIIILYLDILLSSGTLLLDTDKQDSSILFSRRPFKFWLLSSSLPQILDNIGNDDLIGSGRHCKSYSVVINGLRMATNYSFHVRPLDSKKSAGTKGLGKKIIVSTKGCEYEVETKVQIEKCFTFPLFVTEWTGTRSLTRQVEGPGFEFQCRQFLLLLYLVTKTRYLLIYLF